MIRINADLITTAVAVSLSLLMLLNLPGDGSLSGGLSDVRSSSFFPALCALLVLILGLSKLVPALVRQMQGTGIYPVFERFRAVMAVAVTLVGMVYLTYLVGMVWASTAGILAIGLLIEPRHWLALVPVAALVPQAVFQLFERNLHILLPRGVLF